MRPLLLVVVALLAAPVLLAACSEERSEQCRAVCRKGDRCAEEADDPNYKFDEGECTAACAFLEQDAKGAEIVKTYISCIKAAGDDCAAIRRCN